MFRKDDLTLQQISAEGKSSIDSRSIDSNVLSEVTPKASNGVYRLGKYPHRKTIRNPGNERDGKIPTLCK
jgi:hypothetical protein